MDVIDVCKNQLQEVEIKGHYGVFTELRVDKSTIPEGVNCYELRHGDDDSYPAELEVNVRVNYFGTVLMTDKMEMDQSGRVELSYEDFGFTGEDLTMLEYQANYGEEPDYFSCVEDFIKFMNECETPFALTEIEAEKLLGYMSGHNFMLGEKEGKLFRGDLCYQQEKVRWLEDTIDDVISDVYEWNEDLLEYALGGMENPHDFIDFANKKSEADSLKEDEIILDALYQRTRYGKELNELAEKLAGELIADIYSKDGIDGAIQKMTEKIAESRESLPEVSPALRQNVGKAR